MSMFGTFLGVPECTVAITPLVNVRFRVKFRISIRFRIRLKVVLTRFASGFTCICTWRGNKMIDFDINFELDLLCISQPIHKGRYETFDIF